MSRLKLSRLIGAVADGREIDWELVERRAGRDRGLVAGLRTMAQISRATLHPERPELPRAARRVPKKKR